MNTCLVSGSSLQDVLDESREIVDGRNGGLVVAKRCTPQKSLIEGREQQRRVGKELLSILAREYRRGAGTATMRSGLGRSTIGGTNEVDHRLFGRADKPRRTHDHLNDVHRPLRAPVQVDTEVAGEVIEDHVAAIERLQQQDLSDRRLRFAPRRSEQQQARQRDASQYGRK